MLHLNRVHHISIICSDYEKSKAFYTDVLGFKVLRETFRKERQSYKVDLGLKGEYVIELFSFPSPPTRPTQPEARGLRHLAFEVNDLDESIRLLASKNILTEPIRTDEATKKRFTFLFDPDQLPIELCEK